MGRRLIEAAIFILCGVLVGVAIGGYGGFFIHQRYLCRTFKGGYLVEINGCRAKIVDIDLYEELLKMREKYLAHESSIKAPEKLKKLEGFDDKIEQHFSSKTKKGDKAK